MTASSLVSLSVLRQRLESGAGMMAWRQHGAKDSIPLALSTILLDKLELDDREIGAHPWRELSDECRSFLEAHQNGLCIFEEPLMRKSDPAFARLHCPYFTVDESIYYIVATGDSLLPLLGRARSVWPGALGLFVERAPIATGVALSRGELETLVSHADAVIFGADEDERFAIWPMVRP